MSITVEELVSQFKTKALQAMESKHKKEVILEISELETFFGFTKSKHAWLWLPKRFRKELCHQGVRVYKARGKEYVTVTMKEK